MSENASKLLERIMRSNLCNRCGTCVGLGNGKILFQDREGKYYPKIISPLTKEEAKIILNACSGHEFHFPEFNQWLFSSAPHYNRWMGSYENLYVGHANDEIVRSNAGSGGILSALLIYLLEKGEIQGAVSLKMSTDKPWLTEPFIATSKEEILESAQSKYIISSVNEILPQIARFEGKLAYVGLPGQVQAIRKLQKIQHPAVRNISYIFGPFYGNTLHVSSIRSFLAAHKEKDLNSIKKIYFRYGEWPGRMRIEMKNGRIMELPKFHANYLIPFHILKNSLLCTDLTNEFTDISGGDAWAPVYEERGKGFSMVIARSKQGQQLLENMLNQHLITLWPIAEEEAIKMHSHGYDLKKRGTFIRMRFRKLLGLKNPDYGYKISQFSASRYLMEILIDFLFLLFRTRPARYIADHIPQKTMGYIFETARKYWKKATYSTKREKL